jgi:anti-sigma regulatory factor (Ser/Thr protein kinase)
MGEAIELGEFPPPLNLEIEMYPCSIVSLSKVREFIEEQVEDLDLSSRDLYSLVSSVDEAATNAVHHGSNENPTMSFMVGIGRSEDRLVVMVRDFGGKTFDPKYFEDICQRKSWGIRGGRGIFMMSNSMDEVMYMFNGGRSTTVCLIKYLGEGTPEG